MRQQSLLLALLVLFACSLHAQESMTLDAAIRSALERHPDLKRRTAAVRRAEALVGEAARLPNPVFEYSREDLSLNQNRIGEWIAMGSIPLNFLWDRWTDIGAKQKALEAERLMLEQTKNDVVLEVRQAYVKAHLFSALTRELDTALVMLDGVAFAARQRMQEGDISEYEYQRVRIEVNKLRAEVRETEIERNTYLTRLRLASGRDSSDGPRTVTLPELPTAMPHEADAFQTALLQRSDARALGLLIESEKEFLSHNRLKALPSIQLGAGYKRQSDDFAGSVLRLSIEVPLFRRNQKEIEVTEAGLEALQGEREYLLNQIAAELRDTYARLRTYGNLMDLQEDPRLHTILATAEYSYRHGETSLVEFIDGLTAFTEGMRLQTDIEIKYRESVFTLARVLGIPWSDELITR